MSSERPRRTPESILVVKLSAIGDVAQSLFVLPALRAAFPTARLGWIAARGCHELLEGHPLLHRLHVFERERWRGILGAPSHAREISAFLGGIRGERYDVVLDMQGLARSATLALLSGARVRVGLARSREMARLAYDVRCDTGLGIRHAIDRYRMLLECIGAPAPPPTTPELSGLVPPTTAAAARVAELLAPLGERPRVVLQPSARWPTKIWPLERFVELAGRMSSSGMGIIVIGTQSDLSNTSRVAAAAPDAVHLAGDLQLGELPALFAQVDLMVTCDSGPMHIAAAAGTPVVALFGPTDARRTGPYGAGHRVLVAGASCSPCLSRRCRVGDLRCQTGIDVDTVLAATRDMLSGRRLVAAAGASR